MKHNFLVKIVCPLCTLFLRFINTSYFVKTSSLHALLCVVLCWIVKEAAWCLGAACSHLQAQLLIPLQIYIFISCIVNIWKLDGSIKLCPLQVMHFLAWIWDGSRFIANFVPIYYQQSQLQSIARPWWVSVKLMVTWKWSKWWWGSSPKGLLG